MPDLRRLKASWLDLNGQLTGVPKRVVNFFCRLSPIQPEQGPAAARDTLVLVDLRPYNRKMSISTGDAFHDTDQPPEINPKMMHSPGPRHPSVTGSDDPRRRVTLA